MEAHYFHTLR